MKKAEGLSLTTIVIAALALLVLIILSVIFVGRMSGKWDQEPEEESEEEWLDPSELVIEKDLGQFTDVCFYGLYEIEYVDKINTDRCYATRNTKPHMYAGSTLSESFERVGESPYDYFLNKNMRCERMETFGKLW